MSASMALGLKGNNSALLSQAEYAGLQFTVAALTIFTALVGVVTNFLNIKTFIACRISDGVSVSFLGLSISDMVTSVLTIFFGTGLAFHATEALMENEAYFLYDPLFFYYLFINLCNIAYLVTVLTTCYIAIVRCMCVVLPFRFKHLFTKRRTIFALCGFWVVMVGLYLPILASQYFTRVHCGPENGTECVRYMHTFTSSRERIKDNVFMFTQSFLTFASQAVVIVCVVLMMKFVRQSVKFSSRRSTSIPMASSETPNSFDQATDSNFESDVDSSEDNLRDKCPKRSAPYPSYFRTKLGALITKDGLSENSKSHLECIDNPNSEKAVFTTTTTTSTSTTAKTITFDPATAEPETFTRKHHVRLSKKKQVLVQQVILISVIFIVFNTPMIIMGILGPAEPELDADWGEDDFVRMYLFLHAFKRFLEQISSSVNLFIYLRYNARFRDRCRVGGLCKQPVQQ